jgi:hypothetical protein
VESIKVNADMINSVQKFVESWVRIETYRLFDRVPKTYW